MIYSAEVLQMNLFIYLLGSSTDYHYISLQPWGIFANNGRAGGWHWQQWTKTIITSFELFPLNQITIPYIYIYLPTPGQNHYAVRFRLSTASFQSYLTNVFREPNDGRISQLFDVCESPLNIFWSKMTWPDSGCQKLSKTPNILKWDQQYGTTSKSDGDLLKIWGKNLNLIMFPTFTATLKIKVFIKRKLVLNFSWNRKHLSKLNTRRFVWNLGNLQK